MLHLQHEHGVFTLHDVETQKYWEDNSPSVCSSALDSSTLSQWTWWYRRLFCPTCHTSTTGLGKSIPGFVRCREETQHRDVIIQQDCPPCSPVHGNVILRVAAATICFSP